MEVSAFIATLFNFMLTPVLFLKDLVQELYSFRDRFFETHPIEKASDKRQIVEQKMKEVLDKLDELSSNIFKK